MSREHDVVTLSGAEYDALLSEAEDAARLREELAALRAAPPRTGREQVMKSDHLQQFLAEIEERICTCGAGHGSGEGHTDWCEWVEEYSCPPAPEAQQEPPQAACGLVSRMGEIARRAALKEGRDE